MVPNTQLAQECPKLPIECETLGDVAAEEPLTQLGGLAVTGGKVAVWTGVGSIKLRRSNAAVPTLIYKDKLPVYSWKYWQVGSK